MLVVVTTDPAATREFYERFLGFEVVMDEQGFLMLSAERANDRADHLLGDRGRDGSRGAAGRHLDRGRR